MIDRDYSSLLNRPEHLFDASRIDFGLLAKRILVTGAGGSIGSALVRRIVQANPEKVWLVGHGEDSIFQLLQKLEEENCPASVVPVISDAYSFEIAKTIREEGLDCVFHAAAHKHVGLLEQNPRAAIANNTQATIGLSRLCARAGVRFVFISTDKAVNPTTVMGASKRLAEAKVSCQEGDNVICRFGNVLGSAGSLVEIVERRFAAGRPVKITHPDMRRFFITAKEAVGLVLTAGLRGNPGTYSLEMGEPVYIKQLVSKLVEDAKLVVEGSPIYGEKLVEEIYSKEENVFDVGFHPGIRRITRSHYAGLIEAVLEIVEDQCNSNCPAPELGKAIVDLANKV